MFSLIRERILVGKHILLQKWVFKFVVDEICVMNSSDLGLSKWILKVILLLAQLVILYALFVAF